MAEATKKRNRARIINFILFGSVLILFLTTSPKVWLLRGCLSAGLYPAKIEQPVENAGTVMPLTYQDEHGQLRSTEQLQGKVLFINFWASWCPPCIAEMPSMNKMYDKLKDDQDFAFLFINLDDEESAAREFLTRQELTIPLQRAVGFIPTDLYTGSLPTTVVIDKNGSIVMKRNGLANYNSKKFIQQLIDLK